MYKCLRCGRKYNYDELTRVQEYRGEYQGSPAFETVRCCPNCNYDVEYCGEADDECYRSCDAEDE